MVHNYCIDIEYFVYNNYHIWNFKENGKKVINCCTSLLEQNQVYISDCAGLNLRWKYDCTGNIRLKCVTMIAIDYTRNLFVRFGHVVHFVYTILPLYSRGYTGYIFQIYPKFKHAVRHPWSFTTAGSMWGELMFDGPRKFYRKTHEAFQTMEIHHFQWIFLYFSALFGTFALIHPLPPSIFVVPKRGDIYAYYIIPTFSAKSIKPGYLRVRHLPSILYIRTM